MKLTKFLLVAFCMCLIAACQSKQQQETTQAPTEWKLGIQTYSFHKFTLMEALDNSKELGLHYAEAFFFQSLGANFVDTAYLNYDVSKETQQQLKEEFAKRDIKLYSFGVAFYDKAEEWQQFFRFAKEMEIQVVTCEPKLEHLDLVEQLAIKHNIEVAIHNHPVPSVYADPSVLEKALEGRNPLIGVCADIGHWKRTGNDPVATLKRFAGKVKVVHLKDLDENMEDTTWGTGILHVKEVLDELKNQKFDGLISIEYENFGDNQLDGIVQSIQYFKDNQ